MKTLFNFITDNVVFIFNIIVYDFRNLIIDTLRKNRKNV